MVKMYIGKATILVSVLFAALLFSPLLFSASVMGADETTDNVDTFDAADDDPVADDETDDFADDEAIIEDDESEDEAIGFREDKVFLDFKEADIRDVLRVFARKANINIVPSQRVGGTVTVKLSGVHWEKALKLILEQNNFILQKDDDGIYKVFTQEEIGAVPLKTKVYSLSYIKAEEAKLILINLLSKDRGQIEADVSGNNLIISDVPGKLGEIEDVLSRLDIRIRQVSIEVRVLEKTRGNETDIGIKWDALKGYKVGASGLMDRTDYSNDDRRYHSTFKKTDTTQLENSSRSTDGAYSTNSGSGSLDISTSHIFGDIERTIPNQAIRTLTTRTAILTASDFSLTLSALMSDANTELLSHPKIATVDNREAKINVTRKIPIPNYAYNDQTGQYEIKSFSYENIGIVLSVTPQINQDEYITLEVKPSVTTQFGNKTFVIAGGAIEIPIIDERSAETKVIVKSGETLAIAGLVSTDETKIIKKVPLLGDIPIIKKLFRHKSTVVDEKDLIFFITPTLLGGGPSPLDEIESATKEPVEIVENTDAGSPESETDSAE